MKILHTSDWHVGRRINGRDRSTEHVDVLGELADLAQSIDVDLTLVAGDVFDTSSPAPAAEKTVWQTLLDLAEVAPVLVIAGNHDNPARLDAVAPLLARAGVTVAGAPRAPDDGGVVRLDDSGVTVGLLPFVSQRGIVRVEDIMGADPDQNANKYADRLKRIVSVLVDNMPGDTVNIVMGHLTVFDAKHGGGERMAHTIFDYAVPASVFPGHLSYVALGHLHRQQKVPHSSAVWYSGSPIQLDFGEVDDQKGALLVKATPGLPATVEELPLRQGRRLMTLRGTLEEVLAKAADVGDAYVKVILAESARVGLSDEVREAIPNAVMVLLDDADQPRSAGEARQTLSPADSFAAYLESRNIDDPRVEALFGELVEETLT